MKYLLSLDLGSSKCAAILCQEDGGDLLDELVFGNSALYQTEGLNKELLHKIIEKISTYFRQKHNIKKLSLVLSFSGGYYKFSERKYNLKERRERRRLKRELKLLSKDHQAYYLPPLGDLASRQAELIFFPFIDKQDYLLLRDICRKNKLELTNIIYPTTLFQEFIKEDNALLINLGGRFIELLTYQQGKPAARRTLKLGGEYILNDLLQVLKIRRDKARSLLFNHRQLFKKGQVNLAAQVIDARLKEIFQLIKANFAFQVETVYLAGGLVNLPGFKENLQSYLGTDVINICDYWQGQSSLTAWQADLAKRAKRDR